MSEPDINVSNSVIDSIESLRRMRRQPGWDAVARNVCIEALLLIDPTSLHGRLMTERFIDYTLKQLKAARNERP